MPAQTQAQAQTQTHGSPRAHPLQTAALISYFFLAETLK